MSDPTTDLAAIAQFEEELLRRMLCEWDPKWGEPELVVRGRVTPRVRSVSEFQLAFKEGGRLIGLCKGPSALGYRVGILVWAHTHVGDDGRVLPPIPDQGQLALTRAKLGSASV